jgi:protein-disulfide isomerase
MRPTFMTRFARLAPAALSFALFTLPMASHAQAVAGPGGGHFRDTTPLQQAEAQLPAGHKVAIYDFEDLECPACARAFPVTHAAVDHYKIPLLRHDFPLQMHIWSHDAAITARYLQDKVSPVAAEQFRHDVFADQQQIASKDDLNNFTQRWFQTHGQQMPFVMDPHGLFAAEVQEDTNLGQRIGLTETPTIFVLSPKGWTQVTDVTQMYTTIDKALADAAADKPATAAVHAKHHTARAASK